jgi:hypothetical protein
LKADEGRVQYQKQNLKILKFLPQISQMAQIKSVKIRVLRGEKVFISSLLNTPQINRVAQVIDEG